MKRIIFLFLFISIFMFCFSYDINPSYFMNKYKLYLNPDGIDAWTNFDIYFTTNEIRIPFTFEPTFTVNLGLKYKRAEEEKYYSIFDYTLLEAEFANLKLGFNESQFRIYPMKKYLEDLFIYYEDLNGKYLQDIKLENNYNYDFEYEKILKNDKFGITHDATKNNNYLKINIAYINKEKEYVSKFENKSQENSYENFKKGIEIKNQKDKTFIKYYYDYDRVREKKIKLDQKNIKFDFNISRKNGFLKGFKTINSFEWKYDYDILYIDEEINGYYNLEIIDFESQNNSSEKNKIDTLIYKIPYEQKLKKVDLYYFSDTYYRNNINLKNFIITPHINIYLRNQLFGVSTKGYDHFMKKEYDFKGISSNDATSLTLGIDFFYFSGKWNDFLLDKFIINLETGDYLYSLNYKKNYRIGFGNNIFFIFKYFYDKAEDDFNFMINPGFKMKFEDNFYSEFNYYFDFNNSFNFINSFEIDNYFSYDGIKMGIKIFNTRNRRYADGYFRNFYEMDNKVNWYLYFELFKYLYL